MNINGLKFEAMCGEHDTRLRGELIWVINDDMTWTADTTRMRCEHNTEQYSCVESWKVNMVGEEAELIESILRNENDENQHMLRHEDPNDPMYQQLSEEVLMVELLVENLYGEV